MTAGSDFQAGLAKLEHRKKLAELSIYIFIGLSAVNLITASAVLADISSIDMMAIWGLATLSVLVAFVLSVVAIGMWIHTAHANLFLSAASKLEFTPGWSVGWFFVPFANLVQPYNAMLELWRESTGTPDQSIAFGLPLLKTWWGAFLVGGLVENIGSRMMDTPTAMTIGLGLMALGVIVRAISAWLMLRIIRGVTLSQRSFSVAALAFA